MDIPKISILIPIYNVERYLRKCLDSVVRQTLKNIEIILLNDGSTDNCPMICDEYANKYTNISVIHKSNSGYGASLNIGIKKASGNYIGIVEPDDEIDLNMYHVLYSYSKIESDLDVIKSLSYYKMYDNNKRHYTNSRGNTDDVYYKAINVNEYPKILYDHESHIWTGIYRRDFILKNNIWFNETPGASYQDFSFQILTTLFAKKIYFIDTPLYFYNINEDNTQQSAKKAKKLAFMDFNHIDFMLGYLKKMELSNEIKKTFVYYCSGVLSYYFSVVDGNDKQKFYDKTIEFIQKMNSI